MITVRKYFFLHYFRANGAVKHTKVDTEGRMFMIGRAMFSSIQDILNFYSRNPMYRNIKLRHPVTRATLQSIENIVSKDIFFT